MSCLHRLVPDGPLDAPFRQPITPYICEQHFPIARMFLEILTWQSILSVIPPCPGMLSPKSYFFKKKDISIEVKNIITPKVSRIMKRYIPLF
jgi:hypothetical protein